MLSNDLSLKKNKFTMYLVPKTLHYILLDAFLGDFRSLVISVPPPYVFFVLSQSKYPFPNGTQAWLCQFPLNVKCFIFFHSVGPSRWLLLNNSCMHSTLLRRPSRHAKPEIKHFNDDTDIHILRRLFRTTQGWCYWHEAGLQINA